MSGIVRVALKRKGRVVARDAFVTTDGKALAALSVPLEVGHRSYELEIEFDPPVRPVSKNVEVLDP